MFRLKRDTLRCPGQAEVGSYEVFDGGISLFFPPLYVQAANIICLPPRGGYHT